MTMDKLITSIYKTLEDYREDENRQLVRMTEDRIRTWVNQFEENLRLPILTEMDNVFKKRYCSKDNIKKFLEAIILKLTEECKFKTPKEFLQNSELLDLQPEGKSQKIMLKLLDDLIQSKFKISLAECGKVSKKYAIYIDDILCTGLTLINNLKDWSEKEFAPGKTNEQAVADNSTKLIFAYVFIHEKNYFKKRAEMKFKISKEVSEKHSMWRLHEIQNGIGSSSKVDLVYPIDDNQPENVTEYRQQIIKEVDEHTKRYDRTSPEEFFRPTNLPAKEEFFTSTENRKIIEDVFLQKGIEILNNADATNKNMRALGYSIPSLKNFGFGALCFTWRNVPNNAPLVFWYSGGGFTPLFKVTRGGSPTVNFTFAKPTDDLPL